MKFERGRKKNQLIWSFILKVIASQTLFLIKPEKEDVSGEIRFRSRGNVLRRLRDHLSQRVRHGGH